MPTAPIRPGSLGTRRARRATRLRVESLEGRALLAASPLDPAFHGGAPIVSPAAGTTTPALNTGGAVAVQSDGRILVAGAISTAADTYGFGTTLAVRRYNADGSLDTTFGTGGEADVALPAGQYTSLLAANNLLVQSDGRIVVAADLFNLSALSSTIYDPAGTVVARLNANGTADPTFGTGGTTTISTDNAQLRYLAQQADNKILLAGAAGATIGDRGPAIIRLGADGVPDATFHAGSLLELPSIYGDAVGIAATTGGRILVPGSSGVLAFTTTGALDTGFGAGGYSRILTAAGFTLQSGAVQADGKILVVSDRIYRLNPDGTLDNSFAAPSIGGLAGTLAVQPDGGIVVGLGYFAGRSEFRVERFMATGARDFRFGTADAAVVGVPTPDGSIATSVGYNVNALATAQSGAVIAVGTASVTTLTGTTTQTTSQLVLAQLRRNTSAAVPNGDYDGDGRSDLAAQLVGPGTFAIRPSNSLGDKLDPFGIGGTVGTIPVSGDFDGDGLADEAGYLPSLGAFAYRPSGGGSDVVFFFGSAGINNSIPAVGDFDGDGKTDMAVYLPAAGALAVHPSGGGANYLIPFGSAGDSNASIPAIGDYDGDGKADLAVYLPAAGALAVHPSSGVADYLVPFGSAGADASIPVPGDYDGDGKTDVAVYLPASGQVAIRPSSNAAPYLVRFGLPGDSTTVPAPGDYDGDGKTDVAAYLPTQGQFAYRPSHGDADVVQQFGMTGLGATVPASSVTAAQPPTVLIDSVPAAAVAVDFPLTDDILAELSALPRKKPA